MGGVSAGKFDFLSVAFPPLPTASAPSTMVISSEKFRNYACLLSGKQGKPGGKSLIGRTAFN